jgi:two-component system CheB/CheR fusion protein
MNKKPVLVALGSSAGGMEALTEFIKNLKPGIDCAYVVVQHLSPDNSSLLTELLSRQTTLPVTVIDEDVKPEPDHVYITPPNHDIVYELGELVLKEPAEKIGPKPSVNRMLHSMAAADDIFPVGIILSGTGTDGASGLAAIKSAGGLTLAQEPSSSKYNGMPLASIYAEAVDHILEPGNMAKSLSELLKTGLKHGKKDTEQTAYFRVISIARSHSGLDLTHYKPATIERRIDRRMHETKTTMMGDYADYLTSHPEEIDTFIREVLIPVTEFFRDQDCFDALYVQLQQALDGFVGNEIFRAWVPGCATGEEAYSIAIMLEEINRQRDVPIRYQIFATDLDEQALATARQGKYALENLKAISDNTLQRYFEVIGDSARLNSSLRDHITFSKHNLIQDPPFSRLHLVSCRNLLIYFNNMLQKYVYELFHYALLKNGLLFLGKSETTSDSNLFNTLDRSHRIFRSNNVARPVRTLPFMPFTSTLATQNKAVVIEESPELDVERLAYKAIAHQLARVMVVVDNQDDVVYVSDAARSYLRFKTHHPSLTIHELVPQPLRAELKAQLFKARRNREPSLSGFHSVVFNDRETMVQLQVFPLVPNNYEQVVVNLVEQKQDAILAPVDLDKLADDQVLLVNQLQHELNATRESLQTVIEELETSNEELQATNEELQSTNEELQSANEELQTTNEELQSTNEELLTVNDEVLQKNHQLEQWNTEFENLYQSSGIPYLILDRNLCLLRFHPDLEKFLDKPDYQVGTHVTNLNWRSEIPQLTELLKGTINKGGAYETHLHNGNQYFKVEVRPYLFNRKEIVGAVLSFVDITELEERQLELDTAKQELEDTLNVSPDGIVTIDEHGKIISCSRKGASMFGYSNGDLLGQPVTTLMPDEVASEHDQYLDKYQKTKVPHIIGVPRRVMAKHRDGHYFPIELHVAEFDKPGTRMRFIGVLRDISQLTEMERQLEEQRQNASVTLDNIDDGVLRMDEDWRIIYANKESLRWLGDGEFLNQELSDVLTLYDEHTHTPIDYQSLNLEDKQAHLGVRGAGEDRRLIEFRLYLLGEEVIGQPQVVMVFHDVTQQELTSRKIEWESRHDPLTGLLNRNELLTHMGSLLARMQGQSRSHVLLFIDLDQFKVVNDSSGHQAGDELLRQLSAKFLDFIRSRDMLARLGGDEFALLIENCPLERAEHIATNLIKLVQDFRFTYEDKLYRIGASIGIAMLGEGMTPQQVLSTADHACYVAKELGRNQYALGDASGEVSGVQDLLQIHNVTDALENDAFEFCFQQIRPRDHDGHKLFWEVLVRMKTEDGQLVPPGTFIPVAERFNHMHHIDYWVIDNLAKTITPLVSKLGADKLPIFFINISAQSLSHKGLKDKLLKAINSTGAPLDRFCFEITETAAISNFSSTQGLLRELRSLGCHIALDDFGSGMASFNYIRQLPVDMIKIDRHIINDIEDDLLDLTIVQSIQHIAEVLDCLTIAEGVESEAVVSRLQSVGVDYLQGNYINPPLNMADWLSTMGLNLSDTVQ